MDTCGSIDTRLPELLRIVGFSEMMSVSRATDEKCLWYAFGSATRGTKAPSDIDLLLVVRDHWRGQKIRSDLRGVLNFNPIDLTILTRDEEVHLRFIKSVNAVPLSNYPRLHSDFHPWLGPAGGSPRRMGVK